MFVAPSVSVREPDHHEAVHAEGRGDQDAGVHVDVVDRDEDRAQPGFAQTVESVDDPEGEEDNERKVGDDEVEHIDVCVGPRVTSSDEEPQSRGVQQQAQDEERGVGDRLEFFHGARGVGVVLRHSRHGRVTVLLLEVLLGLYRFILGYSLLFSSDPISDCSTLMASHCIHKSETKNLL